MHGAPCMRREDVLKVSKETSYVSKETQYVYQ